MHVLDGAPDFDAFFRHSYATVVALLTAMTGSRAVAEELAQETFTTAHLRWARVSSLERPDLWVRRVALNRAIGVARRRQREQRALTRLHAVGGDQLGADERAAHLDAFAAVEQSPVLDAVRQLPTRQRQLVCLVYLDDRSIEDAAEALGLSASTARTHLLRARSALAQALETDDRARIDDGTNAEASP